MDRQERRSGERGDWTGPERRSRFAAAAGGQLLERSDDPVGYAPTGSLEDGITEFTSDGGAGANIPNRYGGFETRNDQGVSGEEDRAGRGGDDTDDAPRYGDWPRHSTGATSGARGHEGHDFPGEATWGEAEEERKERGADRRTDEESEEDAS